MEQQQGKLFIVSGPSGVGKTTLVVEFFKKNSQVFKIDRVVTYTTRAPRPGDVHGVDYYFIDSAEFEEKVQSGFFLEWSREYQACYGTPGYILDHIAQGLSYILVIDRAGAMQIVQQYSAAVLIWIQVSSMDLLSERLLLRKTESIDQIQTRLNLAKKEIDQEMNDPLYHYYIDNNDLNTALERLFDIVNKRAF